MFRLIVAWLVPHSLPISEFLSFSHSIHVIVNALTTFIILSPLFWNFQCFQEKLKTYWMCWFNRSLLYKPVHDLPLINEKWFLGNCCSRWFWKCSNRWTSARCDGFSKSTVFWPSYPLVVRVYLMFLKRHYHPVWYSLFSMGYPSNSHSAGDVGLLPKEFTLRHHQHHLNLLLQKAASTTTNHNHSEIIMNKPTCLITKYAKVKKKEEKKKTSFRFHVPTAWREPRNHSDM